MTALRKSSSCRFKVADPVKDWPEPPPDPNFKIKPDPGSNFKRPDSDLTLCKILLNFGSVQTNAIPSYLKMQIQIPNPAL